MNQARSNKRSMSIMESVIFALMFVLPFPILCVAGQDRMISVQLALLAGYLALFVFKFKYFQSIFRGYSFAIVFTYMAGVAFKYAAYGRFTYPALMCPWVAFFGYYYIQDKRINIKVFDVLFILLYLFFILTYYMRLPSLFMRINFDDGDWYGTSSSNAIPIILVNVLYIYEVIAYLQKENRRKQLFVFSSINLVLIIMQQSRAGVALSLLFFLWNFYQIGKYSRSIIARIIPILILIISVLWLFSNNSLINEYLDVAGDISGQNFNEEARGRAIRSFFGNMTTKEFLLGYPQGVDFDGSTYTFNVFLDHWNRYTIIGFVMLLGIFIIRIVNYKQYFFPLFFLLPFLLYGWVEPRYLPNYWDFFLYLLLFKKCESPRHIEAS